MKPLCWVKYKKAGIIPKSVLKNRTGFDNHGIVYNQWLSEYFLFLTKLISRKILYAFVSLFCPCLSHDSFTVDTADSDRFKRTQELLDCMTKHSWHCKAKSVTALIIESVMQRKQHKPLFHWNLILQQLLTYLQTSLFLMDTEGTGNLGEDAGGRKDKLLAAALTVSSLVIYNVDGYLQANDLENVAVWFHNSVYAMCNLGELLYLCEKKTCSALPYLWWRLKMCWIMFTPAN